MDNFAIADITSPDLGRFPGLEQARGLEGVLGPGDVLWMPRFHWHFVHQLGEHEQNLSLNFWVGRKGLREVAKAVRQAPVDLAAAYEQGEEQISGGVDGEAGVRATARYGARPRGCPSGESSMPTLHAEAVAWLHASRMVESAAKSIFGERSGAFITAMGVSEDASWPHESKARSVAERLRAELTGVLGGVGAVHTLLRLMTRDGRLFPGLAPAVDGPVVSAEPRRGTLRCTPPEQVQHFRAKARAWASHRMGT